MKIRRAWKISVLSGLISALAFSSAGMAGAVDRDTLLPRDVKSQDIIAIKDFEFQIFKVVFDKAVMGFVPLGLDESARVMIVEISLRSGNPKDFKSLDLMVTDETGRKSKAVALASGGMLEIRSKMNLKSASAAYTPDENHVTWAFVVNRGRHAYSLLFPSGDTIDLAAYILHVLRLS